MIENPSWSHQKLDNQKLDNQKLPKCTKIGRHISSAWKLGVTKNQIVKHHQKISEMPKLERQNSTKI